MNCSSKFYLIIFFFYTIFIASTNPVYIYLVRNTFPNFPYPSFEIMRKFYLFRVLVLGVDSLWLKYYDGFGVFPFEYFVFTKIGANGLEIPRF